MYLNDIAGINIIKTKNCLKLEINTHEFPLFELQYNMLISNNIKMLLPCNIVEYNGFSSFYYNLSNAMPLATPLATPLAAPLAELGAPPEALYSKAEKIKNIRCLISDSFSELKKTCKHYFLNINNILFDTKNIYYSIKDNCLLFIYLPVNINNNPGSYTIEKIEDELINELCKITKNQLPDNQQTDKYYENTFNESAYDENAYVKNTYVKNTYNENIPQNETYHLSIESVVKGIKVKFIVFLIISQLIPIVLFLILTFFLKNYTGILFIIEMMWMLICMILLKKHKDTKTPASSETAVPSGAFSKSAVPSRASSEAAAPYKAVISSEAVASYEDTVSSPYPPASPSLQMNPVLKEIAFKNAHVYKIDTNPYFLYEKGSNSGNYTNTNEPEPYGIIEKINSSFFFKQTKAPIDVYINGSYAEKGVYYNIKNRYELSVNGRNYLFETI